VEVVVEISRVDVPRKPGVTLTLWGVKVTERPVAVGEKP